MKQQKGISTTLSILLIVLLVVVVGGGVVYKYYLAPGEEPSTGEPGESQDETADWKTYRNEQYGFEIKYPSEYTLKEKSEEYTTPFDEECIRIAEISLDEAIIDSRCYYTLIEEMHIEINKTDNTSIVCSKEKVFAPTSNEEPLQKISLNLTEDGWPESKEINGIKFYRRHWAQHSMGGKADIHYDYQTFQDNKCYKIGIKVYNGNSFGYLDSCPSSLIDSSRFRYDETIFEGEDEKIQEVFFPMLSTFRFLE